MTETNRRSTKLSNVPNLLTTLRIPVSVAIALSIVDGSVHLLYVCLIMIPVLSGMDWLDGYAARKLQQSTQFGELYDVSIDRFAELCILFALSTEGRVPLFISLLVLARGMIVDTIRAYGALHGLGGWGEQAIVQGGWFGKLVNGRVARTLCEIKMLAFLFFVMQMIAESPAAPRKLADLGDLAGMIAWTCLLVFLVINLSRAYAYVYALPGIQGRLRR